MDAYIKAWLQFVFPIYIWGVIGLIMFISSRSPRVSRMLGSNPVAVLATLFLFSYAKILRAIISALSLTILEYPHSKIQFVWLSDANTTYLHDKHIPLFVVGILFLVLLFFFIYIAVASRSVAPEIFPPRNLILDEQCKT